MAERTNETWLRHLRAAGPEQQAALRDLRDVLLRRLGKAQHVAEFAEQRLAGQSIPDGLRAVEQHLEVCAECREEYEVLQRTLAELDSPG